jgi:GNAT superfamily N-acetyltransferase
LKIHHLEKLNESKAMPLAVEGWKNLLDRGMTSYSALVHWDHKAFYAEEDGAVIGLLTYEYSEWTNRACVVLGYVAPEHRKKGVYRALWEALVLLGKEKGWQKITGTTHVKNHDMATVMAALGRKPEYVSFSYSLSEG